MPKFLNGVDILANLIVDSDAAVGATIVDIQGSQGQLFSVTNSLTGDLFSVSDISGVPILNVNSSGAVDIDGALTINGGDVKIVKQNDAPILTLLHDGTNTVANDLLFRMQFQSDYDGAHQNWGKIELDTNNSAVRTNMDFYVKSASGAEQLALRLEGQPSAVPNATFAGSVTSGTTVLTGTQTSVSGNAGTVTNGVYTTGAQTIAGVKEFTSELHLGTYNSTVGGILRIHGTTANKQSTIKTTSGNLHIDAAGGHAMYLNYYTGAQGANSNIIFGNGNTGSSGAYVRGDGRIVGTTLQSTGFVVATGLDINGNASVESTGVAATPTLDIINTSSSTFNHSIEVMTPNMTNGENNILVIGRAGSTKNAGYIGYKYSSAGANANVLSFGHWGSDNLVNIDGIGNVGVGTTSPSAKLEVSSSANPEIKISNGGGTSPNPTLTFYRQAGVSANIQYDVANKILQLKNDYAGDIDFYSGGVEKMSLSTAGVLTTLGLDINGAADISGTTAMGSGTVGSAYSGDVILHTRGSSRSIIQQSSSSDAYYMFGDAGANNAAWVGYDHSNGTLSLQAQSAVTINKNTNVSGSVTATSLDINGVANISGATTLSNTGNHFSGHFYFDSYDAAGNHYPHFLDGSSASGATVNWRQFYGSSYKTHTWTSDASGNMGFTYQGAIIAAGSLTATGLDINGSADISGSLTTSNTLIINKSQGTTALAINSAGNGGWTQYSSTNDGVYGYIGCGAHLLGTVVNDNDFVLRAQGEFAISIAATEKMRINASGNATLTGDLTARDITAGSHTRNAQTTLSILADAQQNSVLKFREDNDNYGFTFGYYGSPNNFVITRNDNSSTGVTVMTIGRGSNNVTFTGEVIAASLDISGNADIDGTLNADGLDVDGNADISGETTFKPKHYAATADVNSDSRSIFSSHSTNGSTSNRPINYSSIYTLGGSTSNALQISTNEDYSESGMWIRQYNQNNASPQGTGWQNWTEVWTTNKFSALSDSISTTSSTVVATSTAVKAAYDRGSTGITNAASAQTTANAALPKAGGTMSGNIAMGNQNMTGVNEIEFDDGFKLFGAGNNNYLKAKAANTTNGGIIFQDGDSQTQGYLYWDGSSTSNFGFLDGTGSWAVKCRENEYVQLLYDNAAKLQTKSDGVDITGELQCDTLDVDGNADISGTLTVGSSAQHHVSQYTAPDNQVSFNRTSSSDQWFRIITSTSAQKRIKLSVSSNGDNTNTVDQYFIAQSGYSMQSHIFRLPGTKYNTSKLISVMSLNPSGSTQDVWIKLLGMSSGTGTTVISANVPISSSSVILGTATTTKPTLQTGDTELEISVADRNAFTTMSSRGGKFGGDVTVAGEVEAASLDINGNADISGNLVIAGTVDGVDISGLPTSFAPVNAQANVAPTSTQVKTALNANLGTVTFGDSNDQINFPGNITVTGVTTMSGGTVVNTTTNTAIKDTTIVLNTGIGDSAPNAADIGLIFDRGNLGNTFMGWDESEDEFIFTKTSTEGSADVSAAAGGGIAIANEAAYLAVKAGSFEAVGNILVGGTVDGVDISARDSVLSSTTTTAGAALPKAGGTMSGVLTMTQNNGIPINITGANSTYTAIAIKNTGTGNAGVWFDAINGDLAGSDYGFVGQNNSGYMEYYVGPSSPQAWHAFNAPVKVVGELEATSLDINGAADISGTLTVATINATDYGLASADIPNNAANTSGSAGSVAWGNITSRPYIVNASNNSATATTTIANVVKATYTAAFFDFVIKNGTNVRAGVVYACHDGTNVEFAETSTVDLGDTSDVTLAVDISGNNMRLRATTTSSTWTIKSLIRAI